MGNQSPAALVYPAEAGMAATIPKAVWWVVPAIAVAGGVLWMRSRPTAVPVAVPVEKTVVTSIAVSGRLRGEIETSVGPQTSGRVAAVLVREGDRVEEGQVLARIDDTVLQAQLSQARVALATAQAQLAQARSARRAANAQWSAAADGVLTADAQVGLASRPPLTSDFARLDAETRQAVAVAEARLVAARQRLRELEEGPTREERDQAEAQALQARASYEQAVRDLDRQEGLAKDGAVSRAAVDAARTSATVARRVMETADARLRQVRTGTRSEVLAQAKADLAAAEAPVAGAKASGDAQRATLRSTPRPEDIQVARGRRTEAVAARSVAQERIADAEAAVAVAVARLREAEQAVDVAQRRVDDALVKAPFAGTVTAVVTEAGGLAGMNAPLVRLVRTSKPEIRIDLDEIHLGKVSAGQEAVVSSDAFPGDEFKARIRQVGAQVDTDRGTVEVRLTPVDSPAWLRPGQTLSVNIVVDAGSKRLVVPLTSVQTVGGDSAVFVVDQGKIARKPVKIGAPGPDGFPISEGLSASDQVVVDPTGRKVGDSVAPVSAPKAKG